MTAVAGIATKGAVYIGADSAGIAGWSLIVRADTKVFANGPYAFGFTTSFRMGQLLHHAFNPPELPEDPGDLEGFLATKFVDAVRDCLKAGGWAKRDSEREEGGTFLVGVHGRLFRVGDDYQVGEALGGFDAVGAGHELALGALSATEGMGLKPRRRLKLALEAAEGYSASVRRPFAVVKVTK